MYNRNFMQTDEQLNSTYQNIENFNINLVRAKNTYNKYFLITFSCALFWFCAYSFYKHIHIKKKEKAALLNIVNIFKKYEQNHSDEKEKTFNHNKVLTDFISCKSSGYYDELKNDATILNEMLKIYIFLYQFRREYDDMAKEINKKNHDPKLRSFGLLKLHENYNTTREQHQKEWTQFNLDFFKNKNNAICTDFYNICVKLNIFSENVNPYPEFHVFENEENGGWGLITQFEKNFLEKVKNTLKIV